MAALSWAHVADGGFGVAAPKARPTRAPAAAAPQQPRPEVGDPAMVRPGQSGLFLSAARRVCIRNSHGGLVGILQEGDVVETGLIEADPLAARENTAITLVHRVPITALEVGWVPLFTPQGVPMFRHAAPGTPLSALAAAGAMQSRTPPRSPRSSTDPRTPP